MKPPFLGRRFANLIPRHRPSPSRVLRSFHTFYKRGDPRQYPQQDWDRDSHRRKKRFLYSRVAEAWYNTPTKWYPLPVGVGALLLGAIHYKKRYYNSQIEVDEEHHVSVKRPWQVHVLGALPLRNLSRLWGYLNSLELPVWFRPHGFRFYAWAFGASIDECEHSDNLSTYVSLGDFFYRKLKPGLRPIANSALVSPADGTIVHFGTIDTESARIEQVKGVSYSLDALLGLATSKTPASTPVDVKRHPDADTTDHEFANVNGIEYSLGQLLGSSAERESSGLPKDAAVHEAGDVVKDVKVVKEMGIGAAAPPTRATKPSTTRRSTADVKETNQLYFAVVYLAPGDYHRFHSPTAWVVERRRHFAGELFSVSPFLAKRLANLFVLNERVALLGRWRHGFFSMVPVGATNVGSIKINFDSTLRTNLPSRPPPPSPGMYHEATYASASPTILGGQPLLAGAEVGGFSLGSTIVLVFEAPREDARNGKRWVWNEEVMKPGGKVRVGTSLGDVVDG